MAEPALLDRLVSPFSEPLAAVFGIVGGAERHSLAPDIFNTGFRELGLAAVYLPFFPPDFHSFWRQIVLEQLPDLGLPMRGLTVVSPHKEAALAVAATTGGRAERAGAANCLVPGPRGWHAANTSGLIDLLAAERIEPRRLRTAVVGCGGAGRSIAAELSAHGAAVTLVNRGDHRGRYASLRLGLPWTPLTRFSARGFDLVVNATPLARELPFDPAELKPGAVVADLAYIAGTATALAEAAEERELVAIDGRKVLAAETGAQFRLMTGKPLPPDAIRVALG
jgi:3-dehydroquinate dehydratase/shikimate dehydrogenase